MSREGISSAWGALDGSGESRGGAAPGKRTRTASLVAHDGVSGASQRLPDHDRIQSAFGHHDLSDVRVATGGGAEAASDALGAHAYAYGNRIAFGTMPDLFTQVHEATHVVQQRSARM